VTAFLFHFVGAVAGGVGVPFSSFSPIPGAMSRSDFYCLGGVGVDLVSGYCQEVMKNGPRAGEI